MVSRVKQKLYRPWRSKEFFSYRPGRFDKRNWRTEWYYREGAKHDHQFTPKRYGSRVTAMRESSLPWRTRWALSRVEKSILSWG
jgi:hypothetical protein